MIQMRTLVVSVAAIALWWHCFPLAEAVHRRGALSASAWCVVALKCERASTIDR